MVHARNYRQNVPGATLVAIVDANLELARQAARELEVEHCYTDLETALHQVRCDAVCITTPTFTHRDLTLTAAQAGAHVFCEKPMALDLAEAQEMIDAARQFKVILQVGFMRRFDIGFQTAAHKIQQGEIGQPMIVHSLTRGPGLPPRWACDIRTSNGMLAEVNSHDFDTIRWLGGSEFERIYAESNTLKCHDLKAEFPDFYDNAVVTLRLRNGTLGILEGSCPVDYGYDARVEILGSGGVIQVGELQNVALLTCTKGAGVVTTTFPSWRDRFRDAYVAEARHFVESIITGHEPSVTGEDGKRALEAVLAANRSMRIGMPVYLPLE